MSTTIDLHRVIPIIRPDACYVLSCANPPHTIIIWHGPGEQPTDEELDAGWESCLDEEIALQYQKCHTELKKFILSYYDEGTQDSFNAYFSELVEKQVEGETLTEAEETYKTQIKSVKTWIQAVMAYYYSVRAEIYNATSMEDVQAITWDFESLYGTDGTVLADPGIKLASFYGYEAV